MTQDIKAASIYADLDFRLSAQTMNNFNKFEHRLDTLRRKLANLSTGKFNIGARVVGGGGGASRIAGGISGGGVGLNTLVASIKKQEDYIEGRLITLRNKMNAVKLPTTELDKAQQRFDALTTSWKAGMITRAKYSNGIRQISSDLALMNRTMNVKPPKYTRELNAGWVDQVVRVAKAQDKMERFINVKRDQFERSALNLGNLKPDQINAYRARFDNLVKSYENAPWSVNNFRTAVANLDREMRVANGHISLFAEQMHHFKSMAKAAIIPAIVGVGLGVGHLGREMDKTNVLFTTAFGADAGKELQYLRKESDRLGISLLENARSYSKIAFSLKLMGIEGDKAKKVFSAFSEASLAFGMSSDDLSRAFKAIEQMYSCPNGPATSHGDMCRLAA